MKELLDNYLSDVGETFRSYKRLAEKSLAQISDDEFFKTIDEESNSIAAISKHISGNLRSRWTDFLMSDGEKPDRNRDSEFVADDDTREILTEFWENGWNALFLTLETLTAEDLEKTIQIRGENYPVFRAINRSLSHTASHVGQIMFLAKHFRASNWKTLSVPKNKSAEFNKYLAENKDKAHYLEATREFAEKVDLKE
ncbi:MAG: DUF1572 family protein [Acidobacteriota bacterium]